jgi:1-acyl-sn-glycerol-3-phosphate acyltransferase
MRFLVWMLIHSIYRVRVTGMENIPDEGPVIVASNHVSFVDPLILGGMIRRPVNFVMYYKIYQIPVLNFIFRTGKAIPIAGKSEDPEILQEAYRLINLVLDEDDVLGIFPEGRITHDGEIQKFRPGIEKIISEQPVAVVPVALCNLWGSLFSRRDPLYKRRPYKLWSKIDLRIGKPVPAAEVSAERLQEEVEKLRGEDR